MPGDSVSCCGISACLGISRGDAVLGDGSGNIIQCLNSLAQQGLAVGQGERVRAQLAGAETGADASPQDSSVCVSLVLYWDEPGAPALPERDKGTGEQHWVEKGSRVVPRDITDVKNQKFETPSPELHLS